VTVNATVRSTEIDKFNQLAATWWDPTGPMWPLHRLNALREPYVLARIRDHFAVSGTSQGAADLRILDLGCGAGLLSESMARAGARVTAVDPAERNITIARRHAEAAQLEIDYRVGTCDAVAGERFDVVLNMEVVEHVDDLPGFMAQSTACVDAGGLMIVATINRNVFAWLTAIVGAEYVLGWLPRGTHHYHQLVKPAELEALLMDNGMAIGDRSGVQVNPLTRRFRLTRSTRVNYMLTAAMPN
jgi:2-polyprenyl-6-hydroxyphenyl methylase / 3-demethylubiquinone-9 3-methyltransferase